MNDATSELTAGARILDLATLRNGRPVAGERARRERRRPRPTAGRAPEVEALVLDLADDCAAIRADLHGLAGLLTSWVGR
jgi:hypothetical protein